MGKEQGKLKTELSKWKKMNDLMKEKMDVLEERIRRSEDLVKI